MSSSNIAVKVENLSKCYQIYEKPQDRLLQMLFREKKQYFREFWALKNISLEIQKGETFGVIGRNGSGKSTLLQILAGTLSQTTGTALVNGRVAALLELGSGFNPEFTGRENILLNGSILGLSKHEILDRYDQIVEFADIGDFIEQPIKTYSSGMFVRLAFAVQAHIDASVVIIDEALAVGDVFFRQKCYARLEKLRNSGVAIILVSHSMTDIEQYCDRAILLDNGIQKFTGLASETTKHYYLLNQANTNSASSFRIQPLNFSDNKEVTLEQDLGWPPLQTFIQLSDKIQIGNGQADCIGISMTTNHGEPCNTFKQGDRLVLYYKFMVKSDMDFPICGTIIANDRGIIVHGKNAWQTDSLIRHQALRGEVIACRQEITLDLEPGDYTIEIGLSSILLDKFENPGSISDQEFESRKTRICHVPGASTFSIGLAMRQGNQFLKHHGLVDLPGEIKMNVIAFSKEFH